MDPYRDDRDVRIADLERRLAAAELARDRAAGQLRRQRRKLFLDSVLIVWAFGTVGIGLLIWVGWWKLPGDAPVVAIGFMASALVPVLISRLVVVAGPDEIIVMRSATGLRWIGHGEVWPRLRTGRRLGSLPTGRATVRISIGDLIIVALVEIRLEAELVAAASRHFIDADVADLAAAAEPILDAAARRALDRRGDASLEAVSKDVWAAAEPPLRKLGLELGTVLVAPAA